MAQYSRQNIIEGIKNQDVKVLRYIYSKYFPAVYSYVLKNNGSEEDAKDIFQEALIIVYKKIRDASLELNSSFFTYLFSLCKVMWLKQLLLRRRERRNVNEYRRLFDEVNLEEKDQAANLRDGIFRKHFNTLSTLCREILTLFYGGMSLTDIASLFGYKSIETARQRKYDCKAHLIKEIESDPEFNMLDQDDF